ncbi:hypothetical protein FKP32DRAFT_1670924 [Trametes sanguinea]|nr:hypothetical protein FKP32DRAFT_1670924 [Trametes sanguinea]
MASPSDSKDTRRTSWRSQAKLTGYSNALYLQLVISPCDLTTKKAGDGCLGELASLAFLQTFPLPVLFAFSSPSSLFSPPSSSSLVFIGILSVVFVLSVAFVLSALSVLFVLVFALVTTATVLATALVIFISISLVLAITVPFPTRPVPTLLATYLTSEPPSSFCQQTLI